MNRVFGHRYARYDVRLREISYLPEAFLLIRKGYARYGKQYGRGR
jgi:hypothetical protein